MSKHINIESVFNCMCSTTRPIVQHALVLGALREEECRYHARQHHRGLCAQVAASTLPTFMLLRSPTPLTRLAGCALARFGGGGGGGNPAAPSRRRKRQLWGQRPWWAWMWKGSKTAGGRYGLDDWADDVDTSSYQNRT